MPTRLARLAVALAALIVACSDSTTSVNARADRTALRLSDAAAGSVAAGPVSKEQCKNEGWRSFGFKSQGDCVRFTTTGKTNVAAIIVAPSTAVVTEGSSLQLAVTLIDADGNTLTPLLVTWTSTDASVATVSADGLATAVRAGSVTITAANQGVSGAALITVIPIPVAAVTVTPATATLEAGGTLQLTATALDADGNTLSGRVVTWASDNTQVVTVSSLGLATAVAPGSATITATSEGHSAAAILNVPAAWTSQAPMPTARWDAAAATVGGLIHVIGGFIPNVHEAFDPATQTWTTLAPMPTRRGMNGVNGAVVGGRIYVIGGNASGFCTSRVEIYTPASNSWTSGRPMPTARCHLAVVAVGELIYAIGGTETSGSIQYRTVEIYNPATNSWTTGSSMPTGRTSMAAGVIKGRIYIAGGHNFLNVVEEYDPATDFWTVKPPMSRGRYGAASAVVNGKLYVAGGNDGSWTASVEVFDPVANAWSSGPALTSPRGHLVSASFGGSIYLFGGLDGGSALSTVEKLTP